MNDDLFPETKDVTKTPALELARRRLAEADRAAAEAEAIYNEQGMEAVPIMDAAFEAQDLARAEVARLEREALGK